MGLLFIRLLGRLRRVNLITWVRCPFVRTSVRLYVNPSVRPFVRPQSFSDSDEIWYAGRGRWVMHDGMLYDPTQGQGQVHETFKVWNSSIFKVYLLRHFNVSWQMTYHWFWNYGTIISNFCTEQIFDICHSLCVTWLRTWKGLSSVCKCFCYCNNIRQVAAAFWVDRSPVRG